jgi:hypothetical protein
MAPRRISLLLVMAFLLPACAEKPPIPQPKFVDLYIQLQFLDAQYGQDSAVQKLKADSLLSAFGINRALFDSTIAWYSKNPERWDDFFAQVKQRLAEMKPAYVKTPRR